MQSIDRVDHRLAHQPMDEEPMLVRVDLGFTATSNYKMQAIRRDRAVEKMVWRARPASAGPEPWGAEPAHHPLLRFPRPPIMGGWAPRARGSKDHLSAVQGWQPGYPRQSQPHRQA